MIRRVLLLVVCAAALAASPAAAHESDSPSPSDTSTTDTGPSTEMTFPPIQPGVASGNRVYVRTSAVNPTEYLQLRVEIIAAGFPDTLEVAPGSFIVDIGDKDLDAAIRSLSAIGSVTEVVPAPRYASSSSGSSGSPADVPWLLVLPFSLAAALFVALRSRSA